MRNVNRSLGLMAGVLALALVLGGCGSTTGADGNIPATGEKEVAPRGFLGRLLSSSSPVVVPEGTLIPVTLDHALSSATNNPGDGFDATVSAPIAVDGTTVIPQGARVRGVVVDAESSGRLNNPGRLELSLTSIEVGGTRYDIDTRHDSRSRESHTKRNVIIIGGSSAAGAIIGGIIGGGKGAAIGGAAGAGGGTATAAATGKLDVHLPAETRLSFPLSFPVTIQVKD
jgi:hypothetical protein